MISSFISLILIGLLAFYVAWNVGANDVANSMGTSVGSQAISLRQALILAGVLEFSGAVLFGQQVSGTIATEIVDPSQFLSTPQTLLSGMVGVMIAYGLWLQIATRQGLPVATSHAVIGAIAGFSYVSLGQSAINWGKIGFISLGWILTPLLSGVIAMVFYQSIKVGILDRSNPLQFLQEWTPWLTVIVLGIFGVIIFPDLRNDPILNGLFLPPHTLFLSGGVVIAIMLSIWSLKGLEGERAKQNENFPLQKHDLLEKRFGRLQIISACFVAFAHGSNDVGNAIAPLAIILYIFNTGTVPLNSLAIPFSIFVLGGIGMVIGLAVQGKQVITTVGESIISLQSSSGFCAELAAATTILLASRLGFSVSTSHALVGSLVGIGILQNPKHLNLQTLQSILLAWGITLPITAILSAIGFIILRQIPIF